MRDQTNGNTIAATTETLEELDCAICLAPLHNKRIATLHPCKHQFHRTCIVNWFESLYRFRVTWSSNHTCCLCITRVRIVFDEQGRRINVTYPIDEEGIAIESARPGYKHDKCIQVLNNWREGLQSNAADLAVQKSAAKENGRFGTEYMDDIDEEIDKNRSRIESANRMIAKCMENKLILQAEEKAAVNSQKMLDRLKQLLQTIAPIIFRS